MYYNALIKLRRKFPQVTKTVDARKRLVVTVIAEDNQKGLMKNPEACALARACIRENIADAAIVGVGYTWLIKGNEATRYSTSEGVAREITSFDRHHDFEPGKDYVLGPIAPANRLGKVHKVNRHGKGRWGKGTKTVPKPRTVHRTAHIRTVER